MRFLLPLLLFPALTFSQVASVDRAARYSELYTTGAMTLYLSPDGGNSGRCTQARPCQTLNGAFRWIPKTVMHPVIILPAPGLYPPESSAFEGTITANGYVEVIGSVEPASIGLSEDGGVARLTGTLTAVGTTSPFMTATDSTQNWAANSVRGAHVRFTPDGGQAMVLSNTATTLTLTGNGSGRQHHVGAAYELVTPAVVFQNDGGTTGNQAVVAVNLQGSPLRAGAAGAPNVGRFTLQYVKMLVTGSAFAALRVASTGPRIEVVDSTTAGGSLTGSGGIIQTGSVVSMQCSRTLFEARGIQQVMSVSSPIGNINGPCWMSSGGSQVASIRSTVGLSMALNFIFESTNASASSLLQLNSGGTIFPTSTGSNTGLIFLCPAGSTTQAMRVGFSSGSGGTMGSTVGVPTVVTRNCRTAVYADGRANVVVGQLLDYANDGGSSNVVVDSRVGSYVRIIPAAIISGPTDELALDGVVVDGGFATLNAATPPVLSNSYGSYILR